MPHRSAILITIVTACLRSTPALAQSHTRANHASSPASAATSAALHMRMTELAPPQPGDSARVDQLTWAVRRGIARYADVQVAMRDGYRPLFVGDTAVGQVLHYTHLWRSMQENRRLDPTQPGSLLYEKQADGALRLVGAMFGAPERSTPEQLDARVPMSFARWHLHTNICTPRPVWDGESGHAMSGGMTGTSTPVPPPR